MMLMRDYGSGHEVGEGSVVDKSISLVVDHLNSLGLLNLKDQTQTDD